MSEAVWSAAAMVLPTSASAKNTTPPAVSGTNLVSAAVVKGLSDRSYEKRKAAALDIEHLIKQDPSPDHVNAIITMLTTDFIGSTQSNCRKGGLIALAAVAIGLGQSCQQYLHCLLPPVLLLMQDQESRCRYYACESLYNISKIGRSHVLENFNAIYDGLCTLHADPDPDVRNAASLLDRLMKDIVTESEQFNIASFMNLLQERILVKDSAIRELNVGWIQVLDSVPDIDLLRFLPGILSGLFDMLSDSNTTIVSTADEVLSEFLNEITSTQPDTIEEMIPVLVQQSSGSSPAVCKMMALKWLESFVMLFKARLLHRYPVLIDGLLACMNDTDHDNIRSQAESISTAMMQQVRNSNEPFSALEDLLQQLTVNLDLNRACTKLPILGWVQMILEKHPRELFKSIDQLFPALIQTLSDPSDHVVQVDLTLLAEISRNPAYFDSFFSHLLKALCVDHLLLKSRSSLIVRELCALLGPSVVFCAIARLFPTSQDYPLDSLSMVIQILNDLLLTSSNLYEFRREVQDCLQSKQGVDLFNTLFQAWVYNPVATLSLCFLSQAYDLANAIVCCFADSQVTVGFLIEIDRLIMLIESPVFIRLRLQLLDPQTFSSLVRALHGILMVLPSQGSSFKSLSVRLQIVSTVGMLQVNPKSKINPLAVENVMESKAVSSCLDHFRSVQSQFTASRLNELKEKRIVSATVECTPANG